MVFVPSELGRKIGELVVKACADTNPCNVGYIWSVKAAALDKSLREAFDKATAVNPNIKVVAEGESFYTTPNGLKAAQDMLTAHPDINVITGADQAITGALQAVQAANVADKVKLVGYGGGDVAFKGIKSGERFGTVMQAPATEGKLGTEQFIQAIRTGVPAAGRRRPRQPARRRRRHPGQRRQVPDARGVAGLTIAEERVMGQGDVHLEILEVGKSFGGTRALDDVSIAINAGSVHAFVGENGAGKSTLGKIVAGVFPPDQGQLSLRGEPVSFRSPREALQRGIALVAQEVAVVPQRTVAENVFLGNEPRRLGFVQRRRLREQFERLVADTGLDVPADAVVGSLPLAKQQQVEILRALARDAELIVFDEPTAALSATEVQRFHEIVRGLAAGGRTVILVSHFLGEVLALADTVTVLRDGRVVKTSPAAGETEDTLIAAMLGRSVSRTYPPKQPPAADAPPALTVRDLTAAGVTAPRSRSGPARSWPSPASSAPAARSSPGRSSARHPSTAGEMTAGTTRLTGTPLGSLRANVTMIPESRKDDGLMLRRPVRENVSLASLRSLGRFGFVRRGHGVDPREGRAAPGRRLERARDHPGGAVGRQPAEAHVRARPARPPDGAHRRRADARRRRRRQARHLRAARRAWRRAASRSC